MANDVKLQEGHPVDENLRPLKVGGKSTAIETAQHGNGARVNGDLEITGNTHAEIEKMYFGLIPAYSGMIIGYTTQGVDATSDSFLVTNAFTVTDNKNQVTFNAPPSGNVEIEVFIYADAGSGGRPLWFGLSDNSTYSPIDFPNSNDVTNEHEAATADETDEYSIIHKWVVTGLTAGTEYQWWLGAACTHNGIWVLRWGGTASAAYAPFIMKATALPPTSGHVIHE